MSSPAPVELRAHTAFSFGDGAVTPEAMVERAAALGYAALGITDSADLGGLVRVEIAQVTPWSLQGHIAGTLTLAVL